SSFCASEEDDSSGAAAAVDTEATPAVAIATSVLSPNSTGASFHTATSPDGGGMAGIGEEQLVYSDDDVAGEDQDRGSSAADNLDIHADMSDDELNSSKGRAAAKEAGHQSRGEKRSSAAAKSVSTTACSKSDSPTRNKIASQKGEGEDGEPPAKKTEIDVAEVRQRKPRQRRGAWGLKKQSQQQTQQSNGSAASATAANAATPLPLITSKVLDKLLPDCRAELKARLRNGRPASVDGAGSDTLAATATNGESHDLGNGDLEEGEVYDANQQLLSLRRRQRDASRSPSQKRQVIRRTKVVDYQVDEPIRVGPTRDSENKETEVLKVTGLVRPFTPQQLRELLTRYGQLKSPDPPSAAATTSETASADAANPSDADDDKTAAANNSTDKPVQPDPVWLDRIKTRCYAHFNSIEEAKKVREALDNCRWPKGNSRALKVDFACQSEMDWARQHGDTAQSVPRRLLKASRLGEDALKADEADQVGAANDRDVSDDEVVEIEDSSSEDAREPRRRRKSSTNSASDKKAEKDAEPGTLLDQLFRKTCTTPFIYWMPLNDEQVKNRQRQSKEADNAAGSAAAAPTGQRRYTRLNLGAGAGGNAAGRRGRTSRSRSRGGDRDRDRRNHHRLSEVH
uniref:RRM domain-containing protein n=1 Tax=Macrostomum lignano TaxID=282301 RepID=A0A1I8IAH0_9PLAT